MPIDKTKILISIEEEQAIKDNDPTNIPLDPTAQGWSGEQVRAQFAASITGDEGSVLSELKEKTTLIKEKFDETDVSISLLQSGTTDLSVNKADKSYVDSQDATKADLTYAQNIDEGKLSTNGSNADNNIGINGVTFNTGFESDAVQDSDFLDYPLFNNNLGMQAYDTHLQGELDKKLESDDISHLSSIDYVNMQDATKANVVHGHVESDIIDLDKYAKSEADTKFMAKDTYLDIHDKVLLSKLPDAAKSQTYVRPTFELLPTIDVLEGDKAFVTSTGNSYIWDGDSWEVLSKADWENVSLDWANISNPPTMDGGATLSSGVLYTKSQADTLLSGKSNVGHPHVEADITNLDKYTKAEVDAIALTKSNTGHPHVESDITNLDKYTKAEVDAIALTKSNTGHTHVEANITNLDKYTQAQTNSLLSGKSDVGHAHVEADITNLDKYTKAEADALLLTKSDTGHLHIEAHITNLDKYTQAQTNSLLDGKSNVGHTHVEADITNLDKYTQAQVNTLLDGKVNLTGDNSQIKADKIGVTDALGNFVGTNVETVLTELFDTKVPTSKLGGAIEGNIPLLDAEGLIAPQYLGDRYSDVFKGYGVFDMANPQVPVLLEIYAASQWNEAGNAPIVSAVAYPKRANAIYVTANVTVNTMYRYSEITLEFVGLAPSPLGLGNTAGTAYPGNEGQANRNAITNIVAGDTIVGKATKDASGNTITTTYATKTELSTHTGNTSNPHGVTTTQIGAEVAFAKNTAFNKNFGTALGTVAEGNHNHDSVYEPKNSNIQTHIGSTANPHGVTTTQIGAEPAFTKKTAFNKDFGTIAETVAQGNHNHDLVYEPKNTNIQTHIGSVANPHGVTASQVGLGSVLNYGLATQAEAQAGTASNKYMTPLRTAEAIANINPKTHTHDDRYYTESEIDTKLGTKSDTAHVHTFAQITTKPDTISGYGITDAYTKTETNTQISTAVSGLVDSSPTTLDTLNELAAALGDDPNFATTMTNALGNKVASNAAITGATKTKITYDSKGLVTSGANAGIADISGLQGALDGKSASSHTHGSITNDGKIGSTENLVVQTGTGGALTAKAAGTTAQFLRGDGAWATPPDNDTIYTHPSSGANTTITAANGKVLSSITVDNLGHTTAVGSKTLAEADIPNLNTSKLTAGTLGVARGGTGAITFTSGDVLIGNGTSAVTTLSRSGVDSRTSFPPSAHSTDLLTSGTLGVARGGTGRTDGHAVGVVETRASVLTKIWTGTQAQYDAIGTKDANTLYFII